jgi:hypothetical protein
MADDNTGLSIAHMTLRDHFAAEALNGLLSNKKESKVALERARRTGTHFADILAEHAYLIADSMLEKR